MRLQAWITRCATVAATGATLACADKPSLVTGPTPVDPLFKSYVALGNSLTAGWQSDGINDSTQRESYAALLANQMSTRYAYASFRMPGCPPPLVNFLTQARAGAGQCAFRASESITSALNNVAVPGATSLDPTSENGSGPNPLATFILGGRTQVQRAADARPTFISAWLGNNDVLAPALSGVLVPTPGISPGLPTLAQFQANYDAMITGLNAISTIRGGALVGVLQVAAAPILFPAAALFDPTFKAGFDAFAGGTTTILPTCTPATTSLISLRIVFAMRANSHPLAVGCEKNSVPTTMVGDIFVLDAEEQAQLVTRVTEMDDYVESVAADKGWAYVDPNPILFSLRQSGCIRTIPNLGSATQPFGECMTLDGVHPSRVAHLAMTNALVAAINAQYSTSLAQAQ